MALFWQSIKIFVIFCCCVRSEAIESNQSKAGERDESTVSQLGYESNIYSSYSPQSLLTFNNNGYNNNQNSLSERLVRESSSAQIYGSGHQTNDQFDKKERKTVILAIPVKLSLPDQENYESSLQPQQHSSVEPSQALSHSMYANNPFLQTFTTHAQLKSHPLSDSTNSDESAISQSKPTTLQPLSQKIYSTIDSQLKSASYSTAHVLPQKPFNEYQSRLNYNNQQKQKTSEEIKNNNQFVKNENLRLNSNNEQKAVNNDNGDNGNDKYKNSNNGNIKYYDSYATKAKQNLKEDSKQSFETDSKPEYDYDSSSESDNEDDNTKPEDNDQMKDINYKTSRYLRNYIQNQYNNRANGLNQDSINNQDFIRESGHLLPTLNSGETFDGWPPYYYKPNVNNWPQIHESFDTNFFNLLNGYRNKNKESVKNVFYSPAFDLFPEVSQTHPKVAPNPVQLKSSKIYSVAANYQPLSMFTGYGRDYGALDVNGDTYPANLLTSLPPRKQLKPLKPESIQFNEFSEQTNRDLIKVPRRNPLLIRPSFISGLRPNKPLSNYSPFASASTNSFLSTFPSLPTSFNINKFPRQIFPILYG